MSALFKDDFADKLPSQIDANSANQLRKIIAEVAKDDGPATLSLALTRDDIRDVVLTPALAHSLLDILRLIGSGRGFRMVPVNAELTTQQAADLLNVSRPYFVKLLEENVIPFRKIGRHRRVRAEDLFRYKDQRDKDRADALSELAEIDARLGLL